MFFCQQKKKLCQDQFSFFLKLKVKLKEQFDILENTLFTFLRVRDENIYTTIEIVGIGG